MADGVRQCKRPGWDNYPFETLVQRAKSVPPKLILNPDFQRKYKWDKIGWEKASKFIESCLMRIPLPSCYFAETEGGEHLVIDGVQRITTILRFFNDEFALVGLTAFHALEGKKFSELVDLRADLETTTIRCVVLRRENPENLIIEIFARLNQGAVMLSRQEIRHALHPGPFDNLLHELSQIEIIKKFGLGQSGKKAKDAREAEELVLRFFAFLVIPEKFSDTLSKFLDSYMKSASNFSIVKILDLKATFLQSLAACKIVFTDDEVFTNLSKKGRRQSFVYHDLLMNSLGKEDHGVLAAKREEIRLAFMQLCSSSEFLRQTGGGLQRKSSISKRNTFWTKKLQVALSD